MAMGIEIEVENLPRDKAYKALYRGGVNAAHGWKAKYDGSLEDGTEFVSGVFRVEAEAFDSASCVLAAAKAAGGKPAHKRASVHIHLSPPEGVDIVGWAIRMARIITKFDSALAESNTTPHRREKWAQAVPFAISHEMAKLDPGTASVEDLMKCLPYGRYFGANFRALAAHGTVELRYFDGTSDPARIARYIEVARTLNHHAAVGTMPTAEELFLESEPVGAGFEFKESPLERALESASALRGDERELAIMFLRWGSFDPQDFGEIDRRKYMAIRARVGMLARANREFDRCVALSNEHHRAYMLALPGSVAERLAQSRKWEAIGQQNRCITFRVNLRDNHSTPDEMSYVEDWVERELGYKFP